MRFAPYVGINGYLWPLEVENTIAFWSEQLKGVRNKRPLMIGVSADQNSLLCDKSLQEKRYAPGSRIQHVFRTDDSAKVLNLIHYNTNNPNTLSDQLLRLTDLGGRRLHGFQLNDLSINRPAVRERIISELAKYCVNYPNVRIILQTSSAVVSELENVFGEKAPNELARHIASFGGFVSDILFDMSGGTGKLLDAEKAMRYLSVIHQENSSLGLGVAGGLEGRVLPGLSDLFFTFRNLNIDTERKMKDVQGRFDWLVVHEYLSIAAEFCGTIDDPADPYEQPSLINR
ncbi:MAG: hypothetical protein KGJ89_02980 [Patescibacteria group bacterium]|nr:hypothetical protein [Patescibacteria group bacterium]MDE2015486.1 hypothetical protein [Patescibacteria group bacterium]MDE2226898.1 hypothetical protein [Patescibacteria group bacterium]